MPELIDEIKALQKALQLVQTDLESLKAANGKIGESSTGYAAKLEALEKERDEIKAAIAQLKAPGKPGEPPAPPAPPKPRKEDDNDDDTESGFW